MATKDERIAISLDSDRYQAIDEIKEREGYNHMSEGAEEALVRGIEQYRYEHRTYRGQDYVEDAIKLAALGTALLALVAVGVGEPALVREVSALAATTLVFLAGHGLGTFWTRRSVDE